MRAPPATCWPPVGARSARGTGRVRRRAGDGSLRRRRAVSRKPARRTPQRRTGGRGRVIGAVARVALGGARHRPSRRARCDEDERFRQIVANGRASGGVRCGDGTRRHRAAPAPRRGRARVVAAADRRARSARALGPDRRARGRGDPRSRRAQRCRRCALVGLRRRDRRVRRRRLARGLARARRRRCEPTRPRAARKRRRAGDARAQGRNSARVEPMPRPRHRC